MPSPPTGIQQAFRSQICSHWTHMAGAEGLKIAPASLLLHRDLLALFQAFARLCKPFLELIAVGLQAGRCSVELMLKELSALSF